MRAAVLDETFRAAGGRIRAALVARYRDLDIAEEAFAESCLKAVKAWGGEGQDLPRDPRPEFHLSPFNAAGSRFARKANPGQGEASAEALRRSECCPNSALRGHRPAPGADASEAPHKHDADKDQPDPQQLERVAPAVLSAVQVLQRVARQRARQCGQALEGGVASVQRLRASCSCVSFS